MREAPLPANERARQAALDSYHVLEHDAGAAIDALVGLASRVCDVPIALVSLVDRDRQWFLSSTGLPGVKETPRAVAFCAHAIDGSGPASRLFEVNDATTDDRFHDNPLVTGDPNIRFYAGAPLIDDDGYALGTLCVLDRVPRELNEAQRAALHDLSVAVVALLRARKVANERQAALVEAKSSAADLAALLDSVPHHVAYFDAALRNRFANQSYAALFGHTRQSIEGLHLRDVIGAAPYAAIAGFVEGALRGEPQAFDRRIERAEGRGNFEITFRPDVRDGKVNGFVATLSDVSELREALERSERRNELLAMSEDIAEIGHWQVKLNHDYLFWSPQVYRIHGRDPATYHPKLEDGVSAYHPDDQEAVRLDVERAISEKKPFEFERRVVRPDGSVRRILAKGRPEIDPANGEVLGIIGVFQDVTERAELRDRIERQQRLVTTGTLAAGVGHEINNPLTYVAANVDFAVDELRVIGGASPSGRMREIVEVLVEAREGAERIRKIVRGLRAFAREDTMSVPTDVHAALEISINMAMHELRQRATLEVVKGDIKPVFADESRLSQVFVNLLVNAAHAFESGDTGKNRVRVTTATGPGGVIVVEVSDNGSGIKPEVLARMFDPFFTTKPIGQGTGLGLSICHNVITALGGEITCTTVLGEGTTFRVTLPAAKDEVAIAPIAGKPSADGRGRILLVDDEESVLRALTRLLSADHEVVAINDSREALKRLVMDREDFDVVFCDVMMPHLTGIDLYRRVQAHNPALAERFVFVTGGTVYEEVREFLADIPNERLEKPFSNQNLRGIARRFVALAQGRAAR